MSIKEESYINAGSVMRAAISKYVDAARDIGMDDYSISFDISDTLLESGIEISRYPILMQGLKKESVK